MLSTAQNLNHLLQNLDKEDYDKAISYIEFLASRRKKETSKQKVEKNRTDIDSVIASLTGILPDTGKTLEEYREERLKKSISQTILRNI